jgi:2-polyprenyl-3-methyl-5-hydroxy-6-metoxy-1,4-benzoquinol methylase
MNESLKNIYETHHTTRREEGFSIMKGERGELLKSLIGRGKNVLDIGCRDGSLTQFFVEGNEVTGIDIDEQALAKAHKNLGIKVGSVDLNGDWKELSQQKFDVVVAGEVLEHVYYPDEISKKVKAHLTDSGVFIGSVPNAFNLKNRLRYAMGSKKHTPLSDPTHINHFTAKEMKEILQKHFSKVEVRGLGRFERLSRWFPSWCSFDLFFIAEV